MKDCRSVGTFLNCAASVLLFGGGSPGPVVMGIDSHSEGHGFKSRHRILDGHFSHVFVVKIVMFVGKDQKWRRKRGRVGPFFLKKCPAFACYGPNFELFNIVKDRSFSVRIPRPYG